MKRWFISLGLILLLAAVGGRVYFARSHTHSDTPLGTVIRGDLLQKVTASGVIVPTRKTVITAPYEGYIKKVYVTVGQKVHEGDPIVALSQSARGSGEEVHPLRAPFAGTVVQVLRSEGEYMDKGGGSPSSGDQSSGGGLVRIDDLSRFLVEVMVPEMDVGKLRIGQDVTIKASAILNRSFKGRVVRIFLAAKEQSQWEKSKVEFPVTLEMIDPDQSIKSGMSVIVDIATQKRSKTLLLKHEFIEEKDDQYSVTTEQGAKKKIVVGIQNDEFFEILSGLNEGDRVQQIDFLSVMKE